MLRVFLASSHLGTILITVYARRTAQADTRDVLIIDHAPKKDSLRKTIIDTSRLHHWHAVYDLSVPLPEQTDLQPGLRKKLTRKFKSHPLVRPVYAVLLKRYVRKMQLQQEKLIRETLDSSLLTASHTELGLLQETALNEALIKVFPKAHVRYFEHGLSDYMLYAQHGSDAPFHCVFGEAFRSWNQSKGTHTANVFPLFSENDFATVCGEYLLQHPDYHLLKDVCTPGEKHVLLLLQSIEQYNVPTSAWEAFLKRVFSKLDNPSEYIFLIKPHPLQSHEVMQFVEQYFGRHELRYRILNAPYLLNTSAEVAFDLWKSHVTHVFSLFSSSVYYLSYLYGQDPVRYFHAYDFLLPYLSKAPAQHRTQYLAHESLIQEVFASRCEQF